MADSGSPPTTAGAEFQRLVDIMRRLRGPGGCPWDHAQTLESLRPFVLEETYEVLDAIDRGDHEGLRGEIGDLIFEGVFLAQVESDAGRFGVDDSLRHVCEKLIRRHPHVFASTRGVDTPDKVAGQWEQIKAREQAHAGETPSRLKGLAKTLPALLHAHEIGTRVGAAGFDWPRAADVLDKISEEVAELRDAMANESHERVEEEMGDLLFALANLSRKLGVEPESALRRANAKFARRFQAVERALAQRGRTIQDCTLDELEDEWKRVKKTET